MNKNIWYYISNVSHTHNNDNNGNLIEEQLLLSILGLQHLQETLELQSDPVKHSKQLLPPTGQLWEVPHRWAVKMTRFCCAAGKLGSPVQPNHFISIPFVLLVLENPVSLHHHQSPEQ